MTRDFVNPSLHPEVNQVLTRLLSGAQTALGEQFVGMYLHGSLALGDFDPETSDIDFVVVTASELTEEAVSALKTVHKEVAAAHPRWAMALEGSYIPRLDLRRYDPLRACHLHVFEGNVGMEQHGAHWVIERHVLREHGVVLAGPDPRTLIDPVSRAQLRAAVVDLVASWWAPMIENPVRLYDPNYQRYTVVTMCRVLYTLRHGSVVSKPGALAWARAHLDERWTALINSSFAPDAPRPGDLLSETQELIRFVRAACEL